MLYQSYIIGVVITGCVLSFYPYFSNMLSTDVEVKRDLTNTFLDESTLWIYYDQSDVNSRWWADFGARSSRVIHTPYLNLCYESIAKNMGYNYNIRVIAGLSDLAILLGGWDKMPKPLQNPIAHVGPAEYDYIRAAVLEKFGGLWVSPSTIFLKPLPDYSAFNKVVLFGIDKDETYTSTNPGTQLMYSPRPHHPFFVEWCKNAYTTIEKQIGGRQFSSSTLLTLFKKYKDSTLHVHNIELSRKSSGRRIQIEDLLSSGAYIESTGFVYVPIDRQELEHRSAYAWFLRMSETQILESDLAISELFRKIS